MSETKIDPIADSLWWQLIFDCGCVLETKKVVDHCPEHLDPVKRVEKEEDDGQHRRDDS